MPSTSTSRLEGLTTSVAVKAPCRVATTANIALSGLQTIDGTTVVADERVLVRNQTDTTENGIYQAGAGSWVRAKDFNGSMDAAHGTLVYVTSGTTQGTCLFRLSAVDPVIIGTSALAWVNLGPNLDSFNYFTPEQFGAVGDGVTDDQPAFDLMNAAVTANGGGIIHLRPGATYRGGKQTPGLFGLYRGEGSFMQFELLDSVVIEGNGATLKLIDGLKFGAFDPVTGLALPGQTPVGNPTKLANIGYAVMGDRLGFFSVSNLKVDMNAGGAIVGGQYGDINWQVICIGVASYKCDRLHWSNIDVVNSLEDGYLIHWGGLTSSSPFKPHIMENCTGSHCARNIISIVGGNRVLVKNCVFQQAGRTVDLGDTVSSKPKSACDVECEGSIIRNIHFVSCVFYGGLYSQTCFVADSGDTQGILCTNCFFAGNAWTSKVRTIFDACDFQGSLLRILGGQADPTDNTLFRACSLSDIPYGDNPAYAYALLDGEGSGGTTTSMVAFRDCSFTVAGFAFNAKFTDIDRFSLSVETNTARLASGSLVVNITGSRWKDGMIFDRVTAPLPAAAYYLDGINQIFDNVRIIPSADNKVRWSSAAGITGIFPFREASATWDPASVAAGASVTTTVTVTGAALGDRANGSFSLALGGLILSAAVSATNTITITLFNPTAAPIDLASGTVRAWFIPKQQ